MRSFRFIHAADLHLDSPFRGLAGLPEAWRERVKEASFTALLRLTDLAVSQRADFVVFSGDIYDAKDRSLRAQLRFRQALETLAGHRIPAFVIHGNHDPLHDGYSAKLTWPDEVKVFGAGGVESEIVRAADGEALARVSGISFGKSSVTDNLTPGFRGWGDGLYHIGMLHTNVDGDAKHDNYAPCRLGDLLARGVDYWALGHIHTRRILHEKPWVVYPGNVQGRHIRENGPRGCYLVDVSASGETELTFHALDDVRWQEAEAAIDGLETEQQLMEALEEAVWAAAEAGEGRAVILRVTLTGRGPMHTVLKRGGVLAELGSALKESLARHTVWVESVEDRTGAPIDRGELEGRPGFLGDLLRLSEAAGADPARLAAFAAEALSPLSAQPRLAALLAELGEEELGQWLREAEELAIDMLAGTETRWSG
ncbi:metallophosphoesterase family protein [Paenibacillus naphthalenovorans]|uniref:metallophosphoesterase family protein n=1 Tax=Paenibacillus naphthalenovorans TaxID=162209 RepID=UPI003D2B94C2